MSEKIDSSVFIARGAVVIGDVLMGRHSSVWFNSTIRGDRLIKIGEYTNIQDNSVLHVDKNALITIGDYVTIGHMCIIHGCTIDDNTLIGMGSIIMNRAHIGKNCIIGAGSLVTEDKVIPDGSLYFGHPGKVVRMLTPEEIASNRQNAMMYAERAKTYAAKYL